MSPAPTHDALVVGLGALGAAALSGLARAGLRVLGLDRFTPPHARGSAHGDTRLIRRAYFEDERYIPLLSRAYAGWDALAERTGRRLFERVGLLFWGERERKLAAIEEHGARHGISLTRLDADALRRDYPWFTVPEEGRALFEPDAGFLRPEACVTAWLDDGRRHGAELLTGAEVVGLEPRGQGATLTLADGSRLAAPRVVVAAGAWLARLVPDLPFALELQRAPQLWFEPPEGFTAAAGMPCFGFDLAEGFFYGFPATEARGVKLAAYDLPLTLDDPDAMPGLALDPVERDPVLAVAARFLPQLGGRVQASEMCMVTMSPDEDFLLAEHPDAPGLFVAGAGSGHAFKFAPALADALVAMATGDGAPEDCGFLGWRGAEG